MTLKDYLKNKKISVSNFAKIAGLKQPYVSLISNGNRRPSPNTALRIEQATGGQVTRMEFLYSKFITFDVNADK